MSIGAYIGRFGNELAEFEADDEHQKWIKQLRQAVLKALEKQLGRKLKWPEGEEPNQQIGQELGGWANLLQLQRYAAYIHFTACPPERPVEDGELDEDEYLIKYQQTMEDDAHWEYKNMAFKHLLMTGDEIRYIPMDFPEPLLIEEEGEESRMSIGSSHRILNDLDELNKYLFMIGDYGRLGEEEAWKIYDNEEDQWRFVKWTWMILHWIARESVNRNLCIYFE